MLFEPWFDSVLSRDLIQDWIVIQLRIDAIWLEIDAIWLKIESRLRFFSSLNVFILDWSWHYGASPAAI